MPAAGGLQRINIPGFIGGSNALRYRQINVERTVCGVVQGTQPGTALAPGFLRKQPGVQPFAVVPGAESIRGLFEQDGRAFVVGGTTCAEFDDTGALIHTYTVLEDTHPATFSRVHVLLPSEIDQLLVTSGGNGIVIDLLTNTPVAITAPALTPPYSMGMVIDGYGVVVKTDSPQFNFSDNQDFSNFPALNVAARSEADDNISFMIRSHRELVMIGTQTGEVWQDIGEPDIFAPIQGVFIEQGSASVYGGILVDNTVIWVGKNIAGGNVIYRLNGYTPERVSNFMVEEALDSAFDMSASIAWAMTIAGHALYGLYVPDLPTTWVLDLASGIWTEWARWDTRLSQYFPWFARCHCYAFGKHLVGDWSTGTIYETSFDLLTNTVVT